jgi:hypothetical protein
VLTRVHDPVCCDHLRQSYIRRVDALQSPAPRSRTPRRRVFWTSIGRWDVPRPSRWLRSRRWILDDAHSPLAAVVDPQHTAVLVVDVEPLFVNMTLVPPVDQVLLRLRRLLDAAQAAGVLRIFIRSVIPEER